MDTSKLFFIYTRSNCHKFNYSIFFISYVKPNYISSFVIIVREISYHRTSKCVGQIVYLPNKSYYIINYNILT